MRNLDKFLFGFVTGISFLLLISFDVLLAFLSLVGLMLVYHIIFDEE